MLRFASAVRATRRPLATAALVVAFAAGPAAAKVQVVATTTDLAAIAREVGGERVEVTSIAAGFQDPHFVDAKPSFLLKLQKADLFVEVGMDLEIGWAPTLLSNARNARILPGGPGFVDASQGIERLEVPSAVDRSAGDIHPYGNPHYWLDPANGAPIARAIRDGLARVSPADAALFTSRCADFEQRLAAAVTRWKTEARALGLPGRKIVTYHRSWSYFARAFGLEVVDFVEPRPGIPPSPNHVQALVNRMKQGDIALLVMEDYFDPRLPRRIADQAGVPLLVLPTSVADQPSIRTYFDLFDRLFAAIGPALAGGRRP